MPKQEGCEVVRELQEKHVANVVTVLNDALNDEGGFKEVCKECNDRYGMLWALMHVSQASTRRHTHVACVHMHVTAITHPCTCQLLSDLSNCSPAHACVHHAHH
jgi:hypothetical protein